MFLLLSFFLFLSFFFCQKLILKNKEKKEKKLERENLMREWKQEETEGEGRGKPGHFHVNELITYGCLIPLINN